MDTFFINILYFDVFFRQENVNYMGYYSSHEQLMQQLILQQANESREQVLTMVQLGMEHCRTHMLWETLLNMSPNKDRKKEVWIAYQL